MENITNKRNDCGTQNTPISSKSVIENEMEELSNNTEELSQVVNNFYERLKPLLRIQNPCTGEDCMKEVELTPLANSIRRNKVSVRISVNILKNLLDRLDI